MENPWLLIPPVTFAVVLALVWLQSRSFEVLAIKPAPKDADSGKYSSYACGENVDDPRVQPDYAQFFPFAFFFTIMHVVALIVATVPTGGGSYGAVALAVLFLASAAVGVSVLFRR